MEAHQRSTLAAQAFNDFNEYNQKTGSYQHNKARNSWLRPYKLTAERLLLFGELVDWCEERKLDVRFYVYVLFHSRAWRYAPRLAKGHLMSEKMVKRYEGYRGAMDGYRRRVSKDEPKKKHFDPNKDTSRPNEIYKQRLQSEGKSRRCLNEFAARTYGFHPKSDVCERCDLKGECLAALERYMGFDVLALRKGDITVERAVGGR